MREVWHQNTRSASHAVVEIVFLHTRCFFTHIGEASVTKRFREMVTNRPSPLAALVMRVDAEQAAAGVENPNERHKALVRAAGRASINETLLNPEREGSHQTAEMLAAEWLAYAEVFGTNGMAAGGGRSHLRDADEARRQQASVHSAVDLAELTAELEASGVLSGLTAAERHSIIQQVFAEEVELARVAAIPGRATAEQRVESSALQRKPLLRQPGLGMIAAIGTLAAIVVVAVRYRHSN